MFTFRLKEKWALPPCVCAPRGESHLESFRNFCGRGDRIANHAAAHHIHHVCNSAISVDYCGDSWIFHLVFRLLGSLRKLSKLRLCGVPRLIRLPKFYHCFASFVSLVHREIFPSICHRVLISRALISQSISFPAFVRCEKDRCEQSLREAEHNDEDTW
ncbi:Uncharacterised protein [Chlamydia trachomatis]|nr:Uncharacterised protein [Chlamydia trachomatis]